MKYANGTAGVMILTLVLGAGAAGANTPLGVPELPVPEDNPQTEAKIKLGDTLFNDTRFSADNKVSCATCHAVDKAFTDGKSVSQGFKDRQGTRNAPTVLNAAYMKSQFWDGREPSLEAQALQPPVNPVEGGLDDHQPILDIIRKDKAYQKMFREAFNVKPEAITMDHWAKAIASFERTQLTGNSAFDHYYFNGEKDAMSEAAVRGFKVFTSQGRCVSCHQIEQTQALFTDNRFHNIGVGFKNIQGRVGEIAAKYLEAKNNGADVDKVVLSDPDASELGRFAVNEDVNKIGAFKTPTLRNIELTAPYMHDGSQETLEDMVNFYNNGGRMEKDNPLSPFLSGGIRPLNLSDQQKEDLIAFLKALTDPAVAKAAR